MKQNKNQNNHYLPSDLNAAYLWAQLEKADEINQDRLESWKYYYENLKDLEEEGLIELPVIPEGCEHNAHMFYVKARSLEERTELIKFIKEKEIQLVFHYIPLHSAPAGIKFGRFDGTDEFTTLESERLVRLPMYYKLSKRELQSVCDAVHQFYGKEEK